VSTQKRCQSSVYIHYPKGWICYKSDTSQKSCSDNILRIRRSKHRTSPGPLFQNSKYKLQVNQWTIYNREKPLSKTASSTYAKRGESFKYQIPIPVETEHNPLWEPSTARNLRFIPANIFHRECCFPFCYKYSSLFALSS
jgi:hypothetical protein